MAKVFVPRDEIISYPRGWNEETEDFISTYPEEEISSTELARLAQEGGSFDFLSDPRENIYSIDTFSKLILHERKIPDFSEVYSKKDIAQELTDVYQKKEQEWIKLVGKERWYALDLEKRNFLINTAGIIDLGEKVDIKEMYKYYE